jgi:tetratricopeptide (TPR) repeat protein
MRVPGALIVGVVVACMLGVGPGPARVWAQQKPGDGAQSSKDTRARELWTRGNHLFEEGKYEEALAAFEESYGLSKRPGTLVALANTYELLGRLDAAITTLRQYQPDAPPDEVEVIRKRISSLERRARRQGADSGSATDPKPDPKPDSTSGQTSGQTPDPTSDPTLGQVSESGQTAPRQRPLGAWIVTGAGGAVVAVGLGLGLAASSTRSDIDARCGSYQGQTYCPIDVEPLIDRQRRLALGADIAVGVGLATVAAGVVWLLLGNDAAETPPAISIAPGLQEVRFVVRF